MAALTPDGRVVHTLAGPVRVETVGDPAVAKVAMRQRGLVSRVQMEAAGLGRGGIEHRIARGRLHRVRRGVYQVGHAAAVPWKTEVAALLAVGPGSVLSHRSAARLRLREGLPVTAPARTLLDLGAVVDMRSLERAVNKALVTRIVDERALRRAVERLRGRPGAAALKGVLDRLDGPSLTRSEAEDRMRELLRRSGLPAPRANARVGGYEVDLLWRDERLVVEIDGYAFHSGRVAFERDRVRDADLQALGLRVLRVTWRQLVGEPEAVIARIARVLR